MPFEIELTPSAVADLGHFPVAERRVVLDSIRGQLTHDADSESRRRKRLRDNALSPWELRVGDHRVFYQVEGTAKVVILAVGIKVHNELFIRGRKVEL